MTMGLHLSAVAASHLINPSLQGGAVTRNDVLQTLSRVLGARFTAAGKTLKRVKTLGHRVFPSLKGGVNETHSWSRVTVSRLAVY
jgi:hypothetical protein